MAKASAFRPPSDFEPLTGEEGPDARLLLALKAAEAGGGEVFLLQVPASVRAPPS